MTRQRSFKARVRERMKKTGEHYTTARAHLINNLNDRRESETHNGLFQGYDRLGGVQSDTGIVANVFRHAGVTNPKTGQPYSEAMIHGLCGGPGFLYAVFEYQNTPPLLTITTRNKSMPDVFINDIFERTGAVTAVVETGSAVKARRALEDALDSERAAICLVDMAGLPYTRIPASYTGMMPHQIAVAGRIDGDVLIDDRAIVPKRIGIDKLENARNAYKKGKNRLVTVSPPERTPALDESIVAAIRQTVYGYQTGDVGVPPQFRSNCGLAGMEKWRKLLTDQKDKKGWPKVFGSDARAYIGFRRAYDCTQFDYTAPGAGRGFYAVFLEEAAEYIPQSADTIRRAAEIFRSAGEAWSILAEIAASSDPVVAAGCKVTDRITELLDADDAESGVLLEEHWKELLTYRSDCSIPPDSAARAAGAMADQIGNIIAIERNAVEELSKVIGASTQTDSS